MDVKGETKGAACKGGYARKKRRAPCAGSAAAAVGNCQERSGAGRGCAVGVCRSRDARRLAPALFRRPHGHGGEQVRVM